MYEQLFKALSTLAAYSPDEDIAIGLHPDTVYEYIRAITGRDHSYALRVEGTIERKYRDEESFILNGTTIRLVPRYDAKRKERPLWRLTEDED
jgi:hypothetical protein